MKNFRALQLPLYKIGVPGKEWNIALSDVVVVE